MKIQLAGYFCVMRGVAIGQCRRGPRWRFWKACAGVVLRTHLPPSPLPSEVLPLAPPTKLILPDTLPLVIQKCPEVNTTGNILLEGSHEGHCVSFCSTGVDNGSEAFHSAHSESCLQQDPEPDISLKSFLFQSL